MSPVVAVAHLPIGQPGGNDRAVYLAGKLLNAREKGMTVDAHRRRLDDAAGVGFHQLRHSDHGRSRQQAVGIEHDHKIVKRAPFVAEIFDVAAFAGGVDRPPAVIKAD